MKKNIFAQNSKRYIMKTKLTLFILLIALLALSSCDLFGPSTETYNITLSPGEIYELDLERSGDEESAAFWTLALHAAVSETFRDTINYSIHYRYQSESGYTGNDYVKLALMYHENPWDATIETTGYVEINFTISNP